jgi:SAM-dependent methyltransferase
MTEKPAGFFQGTEMPNPGWWEALWPDPAGVLAAIGMRHGMDVIDLCSGDGWFTLQIAKVSARVTAIDIDPALLEVARHRLAKAAPPTASSLPATPTTCRSWRSGRATSSSLRMRSTAFRTGPSWRAPWEGR